MKLKTVDFQRQCPGKSPGVLPVILILKSVNRKEEKPQDQKETVKKRKKEKMIHAGRMDAVRKEIVDPGCGKAAKAGDKIRADQTKTFNYRCRQCRSPSFLQSCDRPPEC